MIDTHTHIYLPEFDDDRDQVVQRAKEAGVTHLILPNVDVQTIEPLRLCCQQYSPYCTPAMGLHPTSVNGDYKQELRKIEKELQNTHLYCAIGEIGLDCYWDKTFLNEQIEACKIQMRWAYELNLPVIVHIREAFDEIITLLQETEFPVRGIFHSYSGTAEQAQIISQLGDFIFGINGIVTFKKSTIRSILPTLGTDRIVLETDAPYLTPVPHRGKRNEPAFLPHICHAIAQITETTPEEITDITSRTARKIFHTASLDS